MTQLTPQVQAASAQAEAGLLLAIHLTPAGSVEMAGAQLALESVVLVQLQAQSELVPLLEPVVPLPQATQAAA